MGAKVQSGREKTEPTNPDAWFGPILGSSGMVLGKSSRRRIRNSTANRPGTDFSERIADQLKLKRPKSLLMEGTRRQRSVRWNEGLYQLEFVHSEYSGNS